MKQLPSNSLAWLLIALSLLNSLRVRFLSSNTSVHLHDTPPATTHRLLSTSQRILYIVTSLHDRDNGKRSTTKGYDRFTHTLLPAVTTSVESMRDAGFGVDVYLITGYLVKGRQRLQLRQALSTDVGLEIWEAAIPYAYEHGSSLLEPITRALARQHRMVIKDKFLHYDVFVPFEDDMVVGGPSVQQFLSVTDELNRLRQAAPTTISIVEVSTPEQMRERYFGTMTEVQLARMIPGFVRVEAAREGFVPTLINRYPQIPVDYEWHGQEATLNASLCCHTNTVNDHLPDRPSAEDLYYWETRLEVLGVRQLPSGQWVLLQAGNQEMLYTDRLYVIGDYWTGRDGYFNTTARPDPTKGQFANNQGGWMGTPRQIIEWHRRWCQGGFLPPYSPPAYEMDGLDARTVEYWSGGLQLAGVMACNLQRVVDLEPDGFAKHLLYHSSNNKQRQRNLEYRFSSHNIQEFWGQLNTVRKNAERAMKKRFS